MADKPATQNNGRLYLNIYQVPGRSSVQMLEFSERVRIPLEGRTDAYDRVRIPSGLANNIKTELGYEAIKTERGAPLSERTLALVVQRIVKYKEEMDAEVGKKISTTSETTPKPA